MIRYIDKNNHTVGYATSTEVFLFSDELQANAQNQISSFWQLSKWDAFAMILKLTGRVGGVLPEKSSPLRELLRQRIMEEIFLETMNRPASTIGEAAAKFKATTAEKGIQSAMEELLADLGDDLADDIPSNMPEADFDGDTLNICLPGVSKKDNQMAVGVDYWGKNPALQLLCYDNSDCEDPAVMLRYDAQGKLVEVHIQHSDRIMITTPKGGKLVSSERESEWLKTRDGKDQD